MRIVQNGSDQPVAYTRGRDRSISTILRCRRSSNFSLAAWLSFTMLLRQDRCGCFWWLFQRGPDAYNRWSVYTVAVKVEADQTAVKLSNKLKDACCVLLSALGASEQSRLGYNKDSLGNA